MVEGNEVQAVHCIIFYFVFPGNLVGFKFMVV